MRANEQPPGPGSLTPLGQLVSFRLRPLDFLTRLARRYGDVSHFKLAAQHAYLINHPDLIRDVLVTHDRSFVKGRALERAKALLGEGLLTSEGEFHLRQRRLAQPAFHHQRIAAYADVMTGWAERVSGSWHEGAAIDMSQEMMRLTLAIVGKTLLGVEVEGEAAEVGAALTTIMNMFPVLMLPFADLIEKLPLPAIRRLHAARRRLDAIVYRIIAERRARGGDSGDLLSMLLLAQDEESDGARMTDEQVRDEVMTIFLAGHETTANALTWTWYLLSQNPGVEAKLHAEIDAVLEGRAPRVEDLPRLVYTERVLTESLRLYPPAWAIGRRALQDYTIADGSGSHHATVVSASSYVIPAGSLVLVSPYVMHHDARYFPDPFRCDPDRWTQEARAARPKFSFFPFGAGSRQCIGEGFAWMEGSLLVAAIARRWKLRLVPGHRVEPKALITLRPRYGMRMMATSRE